MRVCGTMRLQGCLRPPGPWRVVITSLAKGEKWCRSLLHGGLDSSTHGFVLSGGRPPRHAREGPRDPRQPGRWLGRWPLVVAPSAVLLQTAVNCYSAAGQAWPGLHQAGLGSPRLHCAGLMVTDLWFLRSSAAGPGRCGDSQVSPFEGQIQAADWTGRRPQARRCHWLHWLSGPRRQTTCATPPVLQLCSSCAPAVRGAPPL